jgi:hypothetical protein
VLTRVSQLGLGWLLLAAVSCTRNVRLVVPHSTPSARYDCSAEKKECLPAAHDVPADADRRGTAFVVLPAQCNGRIHEVLVLDADSSNPRVTVTCAALENAIGEMQ